MRGGWTCLSLGKTQVYLYGSGTNQMLVSLIYESVSIFEDSHCPAALVFYTGKAGKLPPNANRAAERAALLTAQKYVNGRVGNP